MPTLLRFVALVCVAVAPPGVRADDPPRNEPTGSELVRQLADPSFRARDKAEQELVRRGTELLVDVERGANDDDLEIRHRCQKILRQIPQSDADLFLAPLIARKEDSNTVFPGWKTLHGIIGDDDGSRFLYAKLYNFDRPLLDAIEKDPK